MSAILESLMLICFGLSWPLNAYKSYKAGTAIGSSWQFIALITFGYVAGIAAKFVGGAINWVLIVYFLNLACLGINWGVYFRNVRLDSLAEHTEMPETNAQAESIDQIVLASDGSQGALKAAEDLGNLFSGHDVKIDVVSVTKAQDATDAKVTASPMGKRAADAANKTIEKLAAHGCKATSTILEGDPAARIVEHARKSDAQLIVMGNRGFSGLKSHLLGSVSREVLDHSACSVWVVKE